MKNLLNKKIPVPVYKYKEFYSNEVEIPPKYLSDKDLKRQKTRIEKWRLDNAW